MIDCFFVIFFFEKLTTKFIENFSIDELKSYEEVLKLPKNSVVTFSRKKFRKICVAIYPIVKVNRNIVVLAF